MPRRPHPEPTAPFAVEVITLVPDLWPVLLGSGAGLVGAAFAEGKTRLTLNPLRHFGKGKHHAVDDAPFGGGAGMVLAAPPLCAAIALAKSRTPGPVLLLTPRGARFTQKDAQALAAGPGMTLVCGRYEGLDERVRRYVDRELSVGDVVLSGGDPAAWCMIDAVVRLRPGVLGNSASLEEESFAAGLLEYPQYTRPALFDGVAVPEVLRSGDHAAVSRWRRAQALELTRRLRPDLLPKDDKS
ncbi:MAG: tRNA (guanosine(37)-N1)-methyltransferase TrmD [Deltaproteobacteria bacterium]|nr:tRNA (guanosine(37)-N1)-methyltransferase TrmD [Deltaproteobacteria bacterium]